MNILMQYFKILFNLSFNLSMYAIYLYMLCLIIIHIYYNFLFLFRYLNNNQLTGSIPVELSSLTALTRLLVFKTQKTYYVLAPGRVWFMNVSMKFLTLSLTGLFILSFCPRQGIYVCLPPAGIYICFAWLSFIFFFIIFISF